MTFLLAIDGRLYVNYTAVAFREPGNLNSCSVRNFFVQIPKHFLPNDFGDHLAFRLVRGHPFREKPGRLHCKLLTNGQKLFNTVFCLRRDRYDGVKRERLIITCNHGKKRRLVFYGVDLVDRKNRRDLTLTKLFNQCCLLWADTRDRLNNQESKINAGN